jgi:two-component system, NtrC family, sensor kinase
LGYKSGAAGNPLIHNPLIAISNRDDELSEVRTIALDEGDMSAHNQPAAAVDAPSPEVLLRLLDLVADPQLAAMAVAEEVLRLSSAQCVVLFRICPDGSTNITALPQDRRGLIEQPGIAAFFNQLPDMTSPVLLQTPDAPPAVEQVFRSEQLTTCLVVPVTAGKSRHGALLVFDFNRQYNVPSLTDNVTKLASLLALILGNATLRTESARHIEERQLRMAMLAVQNTVESIYWLDLDGNILYVNPAAEKELGYSAAELQQMRVSDIDPSAPPKVWGKDGELAVRRRAGQMRNFKTQHRHRDGHLIPIELNSAPFDYDGKAYSMAVCSDISQRLAAEQALRESEEKFSAMFSMTPDPMALTRLRDGVLLEISHSYAGYFGYERNEMLGHSTLSDDLGLWIEPAHRQKWREQLERDGEVLGFETPLRCKDGTVVTVLISGKIVDLRGERCVIVDLRDITRRKQMEELLLQEKAEQTVLIRKLEEAQNQLLQSEKLAAIGQLAAGVAHEINNPMGFIRSNLSRLNEYADSLLNVIAAYESADPLLQEHPQINEHIAQAKRNADLAFLKGDLRNLIDESLEGSDRVRRIVQDLRDFSRANEAEWQQFDIHAGLESTINVVWNEIKYKAELVRDYGEVPLIECIPSRLNQVFMNILVNAAQAIADRGKIVISTRCMDSVVEIAFADTGQGIPADVLPKIFDPFFTTKPVGKGTGLGLSVSYGIIRDHGGKIEVVSKPGVGTTFTIQLPINRAPHAGSLLQTRK